MSADREARMTLTLSLAVLCALIGAISAVVSAVCARRAFRHAQTARTHRAQAVADRAS